MSVGSWTKSTSGYTTQGNWIGVASNSTGQKCIASNNQDTHIWVSSDYGVSWSVSPNTGSPTSTGWGNVTISPSGNKMAACEDVGSDTFNIYLLDTTGSNTWINVATTGTNAPGTTLQWTGVCFSIDENSLAACDALAKLWIYNLTTNSWINAPDVFDDYPRCNTVTSNINGFVGIGRDNWMYTIYGSGSSYTTGIIYDGNSNISPISWTSISSSLDGNTLVACAESNEYIYVGTLSLSPTYYWNFVKQTAAGSGEWKVVAAGPDMVSIAACKGDGTSPGEVWVGNLSYGSTTYAWAKQNMQNGSPLNGDWKAISRSTDPTQFTKFITLTKQTSAGEQTGIWVFTSTQTANQAQQPPTLTCFNKDTKILTDRGYVPVQNLKRGDLVKTLDKGFVPIYNIGRKEIFNPGVQERIKDQLYVCSHKKYPEVFEDLIITGCHGILVGEFKEGERAKTSEVLGRVFITDNRYRLPACIDTRAEIYSGKGEYTIYHFALENEDYYMNYGIYANGLLVETCSKRYLLEESKMTLL
jgi:hypothetical protein